MIRRMPGMMLTMSSSATEYRQVDRELARSQRRVSGAVNAVLAPNVKICATQVLAGIKQNQAARWKAGLGLTAAQHAGIAAYETLIAQLRQVNSDVLGAGLVPVSLRAWRQQNTPFWLGSAWPAAGPRRSAP